MSIRFAGQFFVQTIVALTIAACLIWAGYALNRSSAETAAIVAENKARIAELTAATAERDRAAKEAVRAIDSLRDGQREILQSVRALRPADLDTASSGRVSR